MSVAAVGKMEPAHPTETTAHIQGQTRDEFAQDEENFLSTVIGLPVNKNRIVTRTPDEPFRLTFVDVTCLVVNRTIGTGIFSGPQEVMKGVRSPGVAILIWLLGCIWSFSGAHVFIEYGLNVPRYVINGVEQSVPRSGGELHYLQYVFPWPNFREGTVLFSGVVFGISFICIGNMASNCIDCALRLLQIASPQKTDEDYANDKQAVYGIAVTIAIVTCFIHAFSRRGGIFLSNLLAVIKVCFLMVIIFATWAVAGGPSGIYGLRAENEDILSEASDSYTKHSGYTQAFTSVVFAFFGFYQPNYVLSEIKDPRKTLPRSVWWGMGIVCVLYMAVNICYMIIVPVDAQINNNVAQEFFRRVFDDNERSIQVVNAFLAISSFGNIVVWTFTAVRMKQEIAKQCFIPLAGFFAKDRDFSFGRLLYWFERGRNGSSQRKIRFLNPANHQEKTPVGALVLHLITCVILLMVTYGMSPKGSYLLLSKLLSYLLAACFGTPLALGILVLHIRGPPPTEPIQTPNYHHVPEQVPVHKTWSAMVKDTVNPKVGITAASLYLIGNLYLVIMTWVKPTDLPKISATGEWFTVPVISWSILGFSAFWFLGFIAIIRYRSLYGRKNFVYMRKPDFEWAQRSHQSLHPSEMEESGHATGVHRRGGLILAKETIYRGWQAGETHDLYERDTSATGPATTDAQGSQPQMREQRYAPTSPNLQNTDFA